MQVINFIKKRRVIFVLLLLILLICGLLTIIYYLNSSYGLSQNSQSTIGNDLKGYASLKNKLNALNLSDNVIFSRATAKFNILENKTVSKKDKYTALTDAVTFLRGFYSIDHNPKIYPLINNDFNTFAKDNFKEFYTAHDFKVPCEDPVCASSPEPEKIQAIINEINALTAVPKDERDSLSNNLLITSYILDNDPVKVPSYITVQNIIRTDPALIKEGVNNKIADEVWAYVKSHFTAKQIGGFEPKPVN
jgi:hypothetical protein